MKTKVELFIELVESALIRNQHIAANMPAVTAVWSMLQNLEQASRAAMFIPKSITPEKAAQQYVDFICEIDSFAAESSDTPAWLRAYVIAELEMSVCSS